MLKWFRKFRTASRETKLFIFTSFIWTAVTVLPTIYCYARLDYVRSYDTSQKASESQNITK
jgi:hypothetical protein